MYEGEHNHPRPTGRRAELRNAGRRLGVVLHLHQVLRPDHYAGPHQERGRRAGRRGRGAATGPEEGVSGGRVAIVPGGFGAPSKESNLVRTACFRFGRECPKIVRYLSRWDIQVALCSGCLIIYRKVVNSR
ncbi:hypothetical protein ACQJBY_069031 [Aegilops geniculata]